MSACAICEAAERSSDPAAMIRWQSGEIDRLRARLDTLGLARAEARVRELEEILQRVQASQPQRTAVEVCRELARTDPRDQESLKCLWCAQPTVSGDRVDHRKDCTWTQAVVVAKAAGKQERKQLIERWTG